MSTHVQENLDTIISMMQEGKLLEAFEQYYTDDIVMQENETEPRVGKDANRAYEEAFVNGIQEMHDFKIIGTAYGDNYSAYESFMDVTHKDWGRVARTQVAVQTWNDDGKIVKEKFYYSE